MKWLHVLWITLGGIFGGIIYWVMRNRDLARIAAARRSAAKEIEAARDARRVALDTHLEFENLSEGIKEGLQIQIDKADEELKEKLSKAGERSLDEIEEDYRTLLGLPKPEAT